MPTAPWKNAAGALLLAAAVLHPHAAAAAPGAPFTRGPLPYHLLPGPRLSLPWGAHGLVDGLRRPTLNRNAPLTDEAYVVPQRPGKNLVRYTNFQWRDFDFLDDDGSSGVRFYFYDSEKEVARVAAGLVRQSWAYLSDRFHYKPSAKVPYILYNTYHEFLQTNVFQVQEGVLGVTSPEDLKMSLSYGGDRQLFRIVSTHEMTHQFQIQKVAERAATAGLPSPIGAFPLWFTEGLAEYYAHNQSIDAETDMFLRDVVLNPIGEYGYGVPEFEEDRPGSYLHTYKYGQAKLMFLAETYGEKVIQGVLDQSPRLAGTARRGESREGFMQLLGRIAGEQPQQMNARWHTWLRKRVLPTYLAARQDLPDVTELKLPDELDAFTTSRDGNLIFYRGVERESGRAKLVLIDRRDASSVQQIAIDQHPGTESLHPVLRSVMAAHEDAIAWFALSGEADVLHVRSLRRVRELPSEGAERAQIDLQLGPDREINVLRDGVVEAGDPAFSPDGKRIAFYGLDRDGKSDIYVIDATRDDAHAIRITNDLYAERDLAWGEDGILFASDATESGKFNIFRIDPDTRQRVRITSTPADQRFPTPLQGEAVVFTSEAGGKSDLWFTQGGRMRRLTDFATGISHPSSSPRGIYGISFYGARFRMFEVASPDLLSLDEQDAIPASALASLHKPLPFPNERIPENAPTYNPFDIGKNWRIEGGGAAIGGGGGGGFSGVAGQGGVLFADILRDRTLQVNLAIYGKFELTDALAFYIDRSHRVTYGLGLFNTFQQGRDTRFPSANQCGSAPSPQGILPACEIFYLQREFGAEGIVSYPLSTFSRLDASLRLQGVARSFQAAVDANFFPTSVSNDDLSDIRGVDPMAQLSTTYGYDTTRYGSGGASGGTSFLTELGVGSLPTKGSDGLFTYVQTDAIQTFTLLGRSHIYGRAAAGLAQGSRFGKRFFLSSFDNLRGFRFSDPRLLGDAYYVGQAEFAFPLDVLIRFAFFSGITGIAGLDFGGVADSGAAQLRRPGRSRLGATLSEAWANRTMDYVLGVNLGLGPFELRVHFAHGVDIGGLVPETDDSRKPTWVPNISLHYAYF